MDARAFLDACHRAEVRREAGNRGAPILLPALAADLARTSDRLIWGSVLFCLLAWVTRPGGPPSTPPP